jgi:hypothetical protein
MWKMYYHNNIVTPTAETEAHRGSVNRLYDGMADKLLVFLADFREPDSRVKGHGWIEHGKMDKRPAVEDGGHPRIWLGHQVYDCSGTVPGTSIGPILRRV